MPAMRWVSRERAFATRPRIWCTSFMQACSERADMLAARVAKLIALKKSERAQRKVAVVLFNFPPNAGSTGTAAFLSVFESLYNTLAAMQRAGYHVELPPSARRHVRVDPGGT